MMSTLQGRPLNPNAKAFVPATGCNNSVDPTDTMKNADAANVSYCRGSMIIHHHAARTSRNAEVTFVSPVAAPAAAVVHPEVGASPAVAATRKMEEFILEYVENMPAATPTDAAAANPTAEMLAMMTSDARAVGASAMEQPPTTEIEDVADNASAAPEPERVAETPVVETPVVKTTGPATGGAALAEALDESAVVKEGGGGEEVAVEGALVVETPVVRTAGPAAGWAILAESLRGESAAEEEEEEEEVVEEAEREEEVVPSSGGGWRWKGGRVGVLLAVGAGVAVGAALWGRRR